MKYVAAFRTYTWNPDVQVLADRFFLNCSGGRKVILADETRGSLNISGYEVISHTDDTTAYGLIVEPKAGSLWHNVDYGPIILRDRLPDFDYYIFSESDLAVNIDLDPIVRLISEESIDFVAHDVKLADADWVWFDGGAEIGGKVWQSLLFFMIFSGNAIDVIARERRRLGILFRAGELKIWPFCEVVVPGVLKAAGATFADISRFADVADLRFRPRISLDDPRASRPQTLVHSVLGREDFLRAVMAENDPRDWLYEGTILYTALRQYPEEYYIKQLLSALLDRRDHAGWSAANAQAFLVNSGGVPASEEIDLALNRPAISSSVSKWSKDNDRQRDAVGANGAIDHHDYGFHTDLEDAPWWMVDLLEDTDVCRIDITNRHDHIERFVNFAIDFSHNGTNWSEVFLKIDAEPVSSDVDRPFRVAFEDGRCTRFIRIRLLQRGLLHLRRVRVFGK